MSTKKNGKHGKLPFDDYALGDLVMAKLGEHPFWPAEIRKCHQQQHFLKWKLTDQEPGMLWCHFINDDTGNWVDWENIRIFNPSLLGRWLVRKGPYVESQKEAIEKAAAIYERRQARGSEEPWTPPPDPEMEIESEEDPAPQAPSPAVVKKPPPKKKKGKARRKSAPVSVKSKNKYTPKTETKTKRRVSAVHNYADAATDSDTNASIPEKSDPSKKESSATNNANNNADDDMDDEILAIISGPRAASSDGRRSEEDQSDDDDGDSDSHGMKESGSDHHDASNSSEAESYAKLQQLSKLVSSSSLTERPRRSARNNRRRRFSKSMSPVHAAVIPSAEATREPIPFSVPITAPSSSQLNREKTPPSKTAANRDQNISSSENGSSKRQQKSQSVGAKGKNNNDFEPPISGDIGSPFTTCLAATSPASTIQNNSNDASQPNGKEKNDEKERNSPVAPSLPAPSDEVEDARIESKSDFQTSHARAPDNRNTETSKSPMDVSDGDPTIANDGNSGIVSEQEKEIGEMSSKEKAVEITTRSKVAERSDIEGEMRKKQLAFIECSTLELRRGICCPVNTEKQRRASFSQKIHLDETLVNEALDADYNRKREKGIRSETRRRIRTHASDDDYHNGSENSDNSNDDCSNDDDSGNSLSDNFTEDETRPRRRKRKGSPLVQERNRKRARIENGDEGEEVEDANDNKSSVEKQNVEREEIEKLKKELQQKNNELEEKNITLSHKDEELRRKDDELSLKNNELSQKNIELSEKDEELRRRGKELTEKKTELAKIEKSNGEYQVEIEHKNELLEDIRLNPSKAVLGLPNFPDWKRMDIPTDEQEATEAMSATALCETYQGLTKSYYSFKDKIDRSFEKRKIVDGEVLKLEKKLTQAMSEIQELETLAVEDEVDIANTLATLYKAKINHTTLGQFPTRKFVRRIVSACKDMPHIFQMGTRLLQAWEKQKQMAQELLQNNKAANGSGREEERTKNKADIGDEKDTPQSNGTAASGDEQRNSTNASVPVANETNKSADSDVDAEESVEHGTAVAKKSNTDEAQSEKEGDGKINATNEGKKKDVDAKGSVNAGSGKDTDTSWIGRSEGVANVDVVEKGAKGDFHPTVGNKSPKVSVD